MTQEELNAIIASGGLDEEEIEETKPKDEAKEYNVNSSAEWLPPPPTDDHKVVHQLDDVTKDSEVKASQIFDQLAIISDSSASIENMLNLVIKTCEEEEILLVKLHQKFPDIEEFKNNLLNISTAIKNAKTIKDLALSIDDAAMQAMDTMQYQDIHRQKIERVIKVMRALSKYINSLFEGNIDDEKRVSAKYIAGDKTTDDLASNEDIEALIASFEKK